MRMGTAGMRKGVETIPQPTDGRFDPFRRHRAGFVIRYAVPAVTVFVTLMLTDRLRETFQGTPNSLFFCAIILSGWYGGFGPGILASLLSVLAIKLFVTPPPFTQTFPLGDTPRFAIFFIAGVFISWVCERQRRDEAALIRARDELEGKVQARTSALTTANEDLTVQIAERTRAECELQRLNRAWRVRSACNQAVNRCSEEMDLLEQVCRAVVAEGGYRLAWVGYAENDAAKTIRQVARAGEAQRYLDNIVATWGENERGVGPSGTAIRTARPVAYNEVSSDPRFAPWRDRAREHGLESVAALPLTVDGSTIGALLVYADEPGAFDEKEKDLLLQAAIDLAHGVALLRTRKERRSAEEALKKTEEELARVARVTAMGELTASIAHEVNQPLAAVVTNGNASLRWLANEPPNFDEARQALRNIVRDGNRASDVIARIRAVLKKSEPAAGRLDLNEIIREIVALTQGEVERRGASLRTDLAANLPAVMGDRVRLQQVLLNLVINALDAMNDVMDRPRAIEVRTRAQEPKSILIAVEDSGIGLGPEKGSRLFDAFYTTKPDGLGMGLSISRSIVEEHGGRLWAAPNEGRGATFQFTLPTEDGA
jgi:signal transduction histidine kinase